LVVSNTADYIKQLLIKNTLVQKSSKLKKKMLLCKVTEFVTGLTSGHVEDVTVCSIFVKFKRNKLWGSS